jgi:hypothetical protein
VYYGTGFAWQKEQRDRPDKQTQVASGLHSSNRAELRRQKQQAASIPGKAVHTTLDQETQCKYSKSE